MGGLVSGIIDLAGGNPTEKEQKQLGQLGDYQINTGEGLTTPAAGYYEDILSGDPTKIAQVLAPEISAQQGQISQAAKTGAEFSQRSGGTTAANAGAEAGGRANIINLIGGLQSGAAAGAAGLGTNLESMGSGNVQSEAQLAEQRRQQILGDASGIASSVAEMAMPFIPTGGAGNLTPGMFSSLMKAGTVQPESINPDLIQPEGEIPING